MSSTNCTMNHTTVHVLERFSRNISYVEQTWRIQLMKSKWSQHFKIPKKKKKQIPHQEAQATAFTKATKLETLHPSGVQYHSWVTKFDHRVLKYKFHDCYTHSGVLQYQVLYEGKKDATMQVLLYENARNKSFFR